MSVWLRNKKTNRLESHGTIIDVFAIGFGVAIGGIGAKTFPDSVNEMYLFGLFVGVCLVIMGRIFFIREMRKTGNYD